MKEAALTCTEEVAISPSIHPYIHSIMQICQLVDQPATRSFPFPSSLTKRSDSPLSLTRSYLIRNGDG